MRSAAAGSLVTTAPPSPSVVISFMVWKLNTQIHSHEPTRLPCSFAPHERAASPITLSGPCCGCGWRSAISR